jgi:fructose-1,6-bisphosphatase/inositol monophosphatase family enzyme
MSNTPYPPEKQEIAEDWLTPEAIDGSLQVVQDVFKRFRPVVLERAGKVSHTDKQDGSPVTDTDMEIEVALQAELARRFPGMPVFGEETGYGKDLPAAFWLLDPIDGTKSFIEGIPAFTGMAVLIQGGEAIASVIYNPSLDDMYIAQKGMGAYKNVTRLDLSKVPLPRVALCKDEFADEINSMLKPKGIVCEQTPPGGGFGFTMVLDGQAAARFNLHSGGYTHDYAPGALLVREAGGVLLPVLDDVYTYETRSFVACHPELESTIRPHLARLRSLDT